MQKKSRGGYNRGQALPDGLRRMYERKDSLSNSSSPTPPATASQPKSAWDSLKTLFGMDGNPGLSSTSPNMVFGSLPESNVCGEPTLCESVPPIEVEIEGECEMTFAVIIKSFGVYSRVEYGAARTLAHTLNREFPGRYKLYDEAGRQVVFDHDASFGSSEQVVIVDRPS